MPETVSFWTLLWSVALAASVPSALFGLLLRRFEKRITDRDKEKEEKEQARQENMNLMIKLSIASLSLGEATAEAVQRIPDAHCNGDMHAALQFAKDTKNEYRDFERKQMAKSMS